MSLDLLICILAQAASLLGAFCCGWGASRVRLYRAINRALDEPNGNVSQALLRVLEGES